MKKVLFLFVVLSFLFLGINAYADDHAPIINFVKVNEASSVIVNPDSSMTVTVNASNHDSSPWAIWKSTAWRIATSASGPFVCEDTYNLNSSGTGNRNFTATAPSAAGTYNLYIKAYAGSDNCWAGGIQSETFNLSDAIIVKIPDTIPPEIAAHADVTTEATSSLGAIVTYTAPDATDNVDATAPATCLPASGGNFSIGDTTITCDKTDAAGNHAISTTFKITVRDTTAPVITLNGATPDIELNGTYTEFGATAEDIVDGSFAATPSGTVDTTTAGSYDITYNAQDKAGNIAASVIRTVKVVEVVPPDPDADGDGVGDSIDNCINVSNPDQADQDADYVGDSCDNSPAIPNPDQADNDTDGVGNVSDNCPSIANPNQADADSDLVGDACDNSPSVSNPDQADNDTDGVGNVSDNCPNISNTDQVDADSNGIGDACEVPVSIDMCLNLEGNQESVPAGMTRDEAGNCALTSNEQTDMCLNIAEVQVTVPEGMVRDETGNCTAENSNEPEPNNSTSYRHSSGYIRPTTTGGGRVLGAEIFKFNNDLWYGMNHTDVSELHKRLQTEVSYNGPVSIYFRKLTKNAVKKYQAAHNLVPDGIVGPLTRGELNK